MKKINLQKGTGLAEILVAVSIFSIVLGFLVTASNLYLGGSGESLRNAEGAYLAQEGIEAVKTIRDANWSNISSLTAGTNYYLYFDTSSSTNNVWKATTTVSSLSPFARTFKVSAVNRDSNGNIVTTGGSLDANTEKVVVSVSWKSELGNVIGTTTKTLSTYIANIL